MKNTLVENSISLEVILKMVKDFPNDAELGNKMRSYCQNHKKIDDKKSNSLISDPIDQTQY